MKIVCGDIFFHHDVHIPHASADGACFKFELYTAGSNWTSPTESTNPTKEERAKFPMHTIITYWNTEIDYTVFIFSSRKVRHEI